jgi:two-component system sensor histidine kinase ChiS
MLVFQTGVILKKKILVGFSVFLVLVLIFALIFILAEKKATPLKVDHGFIDLSQIDLEKQGPVRLSGTWEFYWKKLLLPSDFSAPIHSTYVEVPSLWDSAAGCDSAPEGFATYRLTIKLNGKNDTYGLRIPYQYTSSTLWIDDVLVLKCGQTAENRTNILPSFKTETVYFTPKDKNSITILLQISSFNFYKGGNGSAITIGTKDQMQYARFLGLFFDILLFGSFLIMAIYHLGLYLLRNKDKSALAFSAFCILISIRTIGFGESALLFVFPSMGWQTFSRLVLCSFILCAPALLTFLYFLFQEDFSKRIIRFYQALAVLCCIFLMFPLRYSTHIITFFEIFTLLAILYSAIGLTRAIYKKRDGSILAAAGLILLFAAVINDVMVEKNVIHTHFIAPYGMFVFVISQSFILSQRFSKAFKTVEALSQRLISLDKLKDEFLANTSHELKTPLNGIIGIAESLIDGIAGPLSKSAQANLSMIASSGKRLSNLINDLLDFSKIRNNDLNLKIEPVDLHSVVSLVFMLIQPLLGDKKVSLINAVAVNSKPLLADEDRIQQILLNLAGNAAKFTTKGKIEISAIEVSDRFGRELAEITVTDTGKGIKKDKIDIIFEPFQQEDGTISRVYGGTGIGLTITKQLIEMHSGTIRVDSNENEGSKFIFTIPLALGSAAIRHPEQLRSNSHHIFEKQRIESSSSKIPSEGEPKIANILVVDDDSVNLQVVYNHLTLENYNVIRAQDGLEAMKIIEGGAIPDLVLLDIMMPVISGFEVCKKIRQIYSPTKLPIIMLTAKDQVSNLVEGFDLGANDYITKPFSKHELLARIRLHLMLANVNIDSVTGIFNRYHFDGTYLSEWKRAVRTRTDLTVIMIDVDNMKQYNASFGRPAGDLCLKDIAKAISSAVKREGDIAARYGSDNFIVLMPSTNIAQAEVVAVQIQENIARLRIPDNKNPNPGSVTVCIGISSLIPIEGIHLSDLISRTESALQEAKRRGKNSISTLGLDR